MTILDLSIFEASAAGCSRDGPPVAYCGVVQVHLDEYGSGDGSHMSYLGMRTGHSTQLMEKRNVQGPRNR